MRRIVSLALRLLTILLFASLLWATNVRALMVAGSDATSFLVAPSAATQGTCLAVFAMAILLPAGSRLRIGLLALALAAALLSSHRLVIDNATGEIRDVYLAVPVQSLPLNPAIEGGFSIVPATAGMRIGQAGSDRSLWFFSPAFLGGMVGLDRGELKTLAE